MIFAVDMYNNCSLLYTIRHCVYDLSLAYRVKVGYSKWFLLLIGIITAHSGIRLDTVCIIKLPLAYRVKVVYS